MCIRDRSLISRSGAAVDAFNKNAEMLAESVGARGDAVRDLSLIHISEPTRPY